MRGPENGSLGEPNVHQQTRVCCISSQSHAAEQTPTGGRTGRSSEQLWLQQWLLPARTGSGRGGGGKKEWGCDSWRLRTPKPSRGTGDRAASVLLQAGPTVGFGPRRVFCQSNRVTYICRRGHCKPSFVRRVGKE